MIMNGFYSIESTIYFLRIAFWIECVRCEATVKIEAGALCYFCSSCEEPRQFYSFAVARMLSLYCDRFGVRNKCPKRLYIYLCFAIYLIFISPSYASYASTTSQWNSNHIQYIFLDSKRETKIFFAIFKLLLTAYTNIVKTAARFPVQLIRLPWIRLLDTEIIHKTLILL